MGGEWVKCTLADVYRSIDYGFTASAADHNAGPKFIQIKDIVSGLINWSTVPHVATDEKTAAKYRPDDGDIVLTRTGASTGTRTYIKNPPLAVFASYLVCLGAKPEAEAAGRSLDGCGTGPGRDPAGGVPPSSRRWA